MKRYCSYICLFTLTDVQPPLSLSGAPSSSTPVEAGETVQFTCSLDANPAPSYSLWSSDGSRKQKLSDVESGHNTVTLKLEKQHNRMGIFCKAEGSRQDYSLESSHKMYTVNCKIIILFLMHRR